jgi:hypothetical protein
MEEILLFLNKRIREEHGNRVTIDSLWKDSAVDSFGTTMVFSDMDEQYKCFSNGWFRSIDYWDTLTIREIVERAMNESTII